MTEDLKILATFATPIEADMARNRLEASDIRAFLADEYTVGWLWHLGTGLHGVKVLVAESDLPRAMEILENLQRSRVEEQPSQTWACPKCGAEVDGEMEVCWACGTTAEGVEDGGFQNAEAEVTPKPAREAGPKGPPGPGLALLVTFCIPMFIFNALVGFDLLVSEAAYPISGGLLLLVLAADVLLVVEFFQQFYYRPPSSPEPTTELEHVCTAVGEAGQEPAGVDTDALARRACLAALLGTFFCPLLNFYSIWLILRHELYRTADRRKSSFFVYSAIVFNALVCLFVLMAFLASGELIGR